MARFWCEKESYQAAISALGFAGGSRNDPHFLPSRAFLRAHFPKKQHFPKGNPPGNPPGKAGG